MGTEVSGDQSTSQVQLHSRKLLYIVPPKTFQIQSPCCKAQTFYLNILFKFTVVVHGWCICYYTNPLRLLFRHVGLDLYRAVDICDGLHNITSPRGFKICTKISNLEHADELKKRLLWSKGIKLYFFNSFKIRSNDNNVLRKSQSPAHFFNLFYLQQHNPNPQSCFYALPCMKNV